MGAGKPQSGALLTLALLTLLATTCGGAPAKEPEACARGCRCAPLAAAGAEEAGIAANCSSPAAAASLGAGPLGARVRSLRLTRHDDHLSVKEGAFLSLGALRSLHLDRLGLVKVYPGAFRGLDVLEELDLSHNSLSAGDEVSRALRDLPQLRRLSLRGNNFGSAHGSAPELASRTIKFVDLGRCKLRDLPPAVLSGLSHVRHIVLDGNFIRSFKADAFPRSVVSLDLSHNDIDRISTKELNKLENVDAIELAENPLFCNCDLLQISYDFNINKPIVCASPKHLMGKDLLKVKKHQVCGSHKKIKREAGNELDDETLSEEDNADELGDDMPPEGESRKESVAEGDTDVNDGNSKKDLRNNDDASESDTNDDHKDDITSDGNEDQPMQPENASPKESSGPAEDLNAENAEHVEEDDSGPENIYEEESKTVHETDTSRGDHEISDVHGDRIVSDDKSEVDDEDEESPEELLYVPEHKETPVEEQTNEENEESEKTNDEDNPAVENDSDATVEDSKLTDSTDLNADLANFGDSNMNSADKNDAEHEDETDDTIVVDDATVVEENADTADEDDGEDNSKGANVENDDADIKTDGGTVTNTAEKDGNDEVGSLSEEDNPPDSLPASEYTKLQAAREEEKENEKKTKLDDEEDDEEESVKEDNLPDASADDVKVTHAEGEIQESEGSSIKSEPEDETNEEIINPNDNLLTAVDNKGESDDIVPKEKNDSTEDDMEQEEESEMNSKETSVQPDDQVVETVEDSVNVVHTNDVGARAEAESNAAGDAEINEEDVEDGDTGGSSLDAAPVGDILEETSENSEDEVEKSVNNSEDKDDDAVNADEEEMVDEHERDGTLPITGEKEDSADGDDSEDTFRTNGARSMTADTENTESEIEILEKELEGDRIHSTLSHSDLIQEMPNKSEEESDENAELDNNDSTDDKKDSDSVFPPFSVADDEDSDGENVKEETKDNGTEPESLDKDNEDSVAPDEPEADDLVPEKDYEEIKEGGENSGSPGDKIAVALDNEDSEEEEGSGATIDEPENEVLVPKNRESDWTEDAESTENDKEAVPPLENGESHDGDESSGTPLSGEKLDVSEEQKEDLHSKDIVGSDNVTEEGSGGNPMNGVALEEDEDENLAPTENDYGSGMMVPFANFPQPKETTSTWDEEKEDEESSGKGPYIPVVHGFDDTSNNDKSLENEGGDDVDETYDSPTTLPPPIVEEEVVPRRKTPLFAAPPRAPVLDTGKPSEDEEEDDGDGDEDINQEDHGRAFGPPQINAENDATDAVNPVAPPDDAIDRIVEGADVDDGKTKGKVLAAVPDQDSAADGSEALNKEDAISFNSIASYIIVGVIMVIIVILLAYAVCRSRRQKNSTAKEKDVENPGREMHDVHKPLINNHHPSVPEKQPLDETQQPLMTKEQEASLSVEPTQKTAFPPEDSDHKPKQNGSVPEVVVERPAAPVANGKAASPAGIRVPSPVVPVAAAPPSPISAPEAAVPPTTVLPAASPAVSPSRSPAHSPSGDGHVNGSAVPLVNGDSHSPPRAVSPSQPPASSAASQPPVSPGAVRVVAKELPDSVAKRPVIIVNRGAEPAQQV